MSEREALDETDETETELEDEHGDSGIATIAPVAAATPQPANFLQQQVVLPPDAAAHAVDRLGPKGLAKLADNQFAMGMRQLELSERQIAGDIEIRKAEIEERRHRRELRNAANDKASSRRHSLIVALLVLGAAAVIVSLFVVGGDTWKHLRELIAVGVGLLGARALGKQEQAQKTQDDQDDGRS